MLSAGALSDPAAVRPLVDAVTRHVVLDRGLDLDRLIAQFGRMSGGDIRFVTIPTGNPALDTAVDGIAVQVDPVEVRDFVRATIAATDAAAAAPTTVPAPTPTPTRPQRRPRPPPTAVATSAARPTSISAAGVTCVD